LLAALLATNTDDPRCSRAMPVRAENPATAVDLVFLPDQGRASSASGCAVVMRCGTLCTRVNAIRLPRGTADVSLARPAGLVSPGQGRRDPHPAPPGRRAPAPGKDPRAVVG